MSRTEARSTLSDAARILGRCRRLLVLAGAGASADCGVPTFRDAGGHWQSQRPEDLASAAGFARDPDGVWEWYRSRRLAVARCQPHAGQRALVLLSQHYVGQVLVATTNEDDLLERAGLNPVLHLHGSLFDTICVAGCGWRTRDDLDNAASFLDCPRCGAAVRPGSVWFGEPLPRPALATLSAFDPDGCLVVGASGLVQPIAAIPPEMALAGKPVVEINPNPTPLAGLAALALAGTAAELLPPLVDLLTSACVRERAVTGGDTELLP